MPFNSPQGAYIWSYEALFVETYTLVSLQLAL